MKIDKDSKHQPTEKPWQRRQKRRQKQFFVNFSLKTTSFIYMTPFRHTWLNQPSNHYKYRHVHSRTLLTKLARIPTKVELSGSLLPPLRVLLFRLKVPLRLPSPLIPASRSRRSWYNRHTHILTSTVTHWSRDFRGSRLHTCVNGGAHTRQRLSFNVNYM